MEIDYFKIKGSSKYICMILDIYNKIIADFLIGIQDYHLKNSGNN